MMPRMERIFVIFAMIVLSAPTRGQEFTENEGRVIARRSSLISAQLEGECWKDKSRSAPERYECYVKAHRCDAQLTTGCLKATSYLATRSDGRQVRVSGVYRWYDSQQVQGFELPHFLLEYMRLLREAYRAEPLTYRNQLYNQIDFLVSDAVDRNGALVWENKYGIAQGMEQAEYADYFASAAAVFRDKGDLQSARGIMNYALQFIRALDMPAGEHTGGVSSGPFYCGSKRARFRPGYWFHSRGRGIDTTGIQTVLNQHLHVIRDLLNMYLNVMNAKDLVSPEFGTPQEVLERLEDRAIGGLYLLAFSVGNTSIQRSRPPNIRQFMSYREQVTIKSSEQYPDGNPLDYYWAHYQFDMNTGKGMDIAHEGTCHYHTHTVEIMASIKDILDRNSSIFKSTVNGWRLYEAVDALLAGKGEPTGLKGSVNAIYQFYRSEGPAYKLRRQGCNYGETLSDLASQIYSSLYQ